MRTEDADFGTVAPVEILGEQQWLRDAWQYGGDIHHDGRRRFYGEFMMGSRILGFIDAAATTVVLMLFLLSFRMSGDGGAAGIGRKFNVRYSR